MEKIETIVAESAFVLGSEVIDFEKNYASLEGAEFCVGVDNGTNAIELMLRAAGVKANDEVITSAMTFIATIFAIERIGAKAILVDTLPNSPLMDYSKIQECVSARTKAILFVTLHGRVEHLNYYSEIAKSNGLALLIDGAQSHLAKYENQPLTRFVTAVSTSFYPGKNFGSLGEGGAVLTDQKEIAEKIKVHRDWGSKMKYHHDEWGGNFRLHAIQAAFLSVKLPHLASWTEKRKQIAERYRANIHDGLVRPMYLPEGDHVYHIYDLKLGDRQRAIKVFDRNKISWGIHYPKVVSDNQAYQHLGDKEFTNARNFAESTLSIPLFPDMTEEEIERVIETCNEIGRDN